MFAERSSGRDARGIMCENMVAAEREWNRKTKETEVLWEGEGITKSLAVEGFQLLLSNDDSTKPCQACSSRPEAADNHSRHARLLPKTHQQAQGPRRNIATILYYAQM